jgi:polysaccharide export outer membrane protein
MAPVWVARAFRLPIIAAMAALALSACTHTTGPVAMAQPQGDLDALAYGRPYPPAIAVADSGGPFSALRNSFATAPRAYAPGPVLYAEVPIPVAYDTAYRLDAGDRLRVVVFGQEGLTNTYAIDAGGSITMPLIGSVPARGRTPSGLAAEIGAKLRHGFIRDPSVSVEIESYRPFFILGEVAAPGQYPYVPNMSVESAVAIAGGFSPRARRDSVTLTHYDGSNTMRMMVPLGTGVGPGDTVMVGERWF